VSPSGFISLQAALDAVLREFGLTTGIINATIHRIWPKVVGEEVARKSRPGLLKNGRLQVFVTDSVWLQQLSMLKPKLLETLKAHLGAPIVQDLFFTLGMPLASQGTDSPPRRREAQLSPADEARIEELLQPLQDLECREVLARILRKTQR
jgi:predicted nucleic acid-binding Zn ribbon protein